MKVTKETLELIAKEQIRAVELKKAAGQRGTRHEDKSQALNATLDRLHQADDIKDERVLKFQSMCDKLFLLDHALYAGGQNKEYRGIKSTNFYKSQFLPYTMESEFSKAMVTTGVGTGAEWLPVEFSNQLIQKVQLALTIAPIFDRKEMTAPTAELPIKNLFSKAKKGLENTATSEGSFGTGKVELKTQELISWIPVSYNLEEDSVINMISEIEWDIVNGLARAQDNLVLNGTSLAYGSTWDKTNIDGAAYPDGNDQEFVFPGIRDYILNNDNTTNPLRLDISDSSYTTNAENISKLISSLKRYRGRNTDLVIIASVAGEGILRTLKTSGGHPLLQPIYSAGADATINKLTVNQIYGVPVIISEFMRDDLNASGFNDHTGGYGATKYTGIIIARRDGFTFGDRRKVMVETFRNVIYRKTDFVATQRVGFVPRYPNGDPFAVMGVKLAV